MMGEKVDDSFTDSLREALDNLSQEAKELYLDSEVAELRDLPDSLTFFRDYVSPNKPVVIRGGIDWPALTKWTPEYFRSVAGDESVCVAVTPNGYADAVSNGLFVMPEERLMNFGEFLDILDNPESANGVFYIQKQNSNFTEDFKTLLTDAASDIPWATKSFGKKPDAVNFWMGDERAVTSLHKDHYENLYCVVSGWKKFILIAPTDLPHLTYELYQPATYRETQEGNFTVEVIQEADKVPWISVDPLKPDLISYPDFDKARCYEVTIRAGDILYLPSLWIHHVRQSHGCVAVNFWYDMEFDIKYNYFKFLEKITDVAQRTQKEGTKS